MRTMLVTVVCLVPLLAMMAAQGSTPAKPRARDLGLRPGVFEPGPLNAITDVAGVRVGHVTLIEGDSVRTGVTAIVPHGGNVFQQKVPGAVFVGNAFGKLAGSTQVEELGTIETPIVLTNTLAVGAAVEGIVSWTLAQPGNGEVRSVNALVGETNDGGLNDIRGLHVRPEHVRRAIEQAAAGPVTEGSVGAGTGTRAFAWKGGIGTASRKLPPQYGGYALGVLVQTNFGGVLTMDGVPVGKALGKYAYAPGAAANVGPNVGSDPLHKATQGVESLTSGSLTPGDGSCMIVVATDAPLDARDLKRLAARAVVGLARTGSSYSNGSGDYAVAFSTAPDLRVAFGDTTPRARTLLPTDAVSPLFQAVLEATEEAVYNSLLQATTVTSRFGTADALPLDALKSLIARYGRAK